MGLKGITAEIAIISSAAPTAVNSLLLAIQYDSEPDFASQTVFFSTIISSITVSFVIFLVVWKFKIKYNNFRYQWELKKIAPN